LLETGAICGSIFDAAWLGRAICELDTLPQSLFDRVKTVYNER
jgi:hypothetical protein